jgi:hypothetical protein
MLGLLSDLNNTATLLVERQEYSAPGHYWQMAANFRKVFIEDGREYMFISPSSLVAFSEDQTFSSEVKKLSYVTVPSDEDFYQNVLNEIEKFATQYTGVSIILIFLWLYDLAIEDFQAALKLTEKYPITISGISFFTGDNSKNHDFIYEKEFSESGSCKKLWVWAEIPLNRKINGNSKLRRLPEYHPSIPRLQVPTDPTLGFFGKLNAARGLPEVLLAALFNPSIKVVIKGYEYQRLQMWRATKYKFMTHSNWRRKPWVSVIRKILNRFFLFLLNLPNVEFSPIPFSNDPEMQKAITKCSAIFYGAKLPYSSGVALTSLASATPVIWFGNDGEAVSQLMKAFPEGRIRYLDVFIPGRIAKKLENVTKLTPSEMYGWLEFKNEVLNLTP